MSAKVRQILTVDNKSLRLLYFLVYYLNSAKLLLAINKHLLTCLYPFLMKNSAFWHSTIWLIVQYNKAFFFSNSPMQGLVICSGLPVRYCWKIFLSWAVITKTSFIIYFLTELARLVQITWWQQLLFDPDNIS